MGYALNMYATEFRRVCSKALRAVSNSMARAAAFSGVMILVNTVWSKTRPLLNRVGAVAGVGVTSP